MMIDQLRKTPITLFRVNPDSYYLDENRQPVYEETSIPALCSIQPYQDGDNTFRTPDGFYSLYGIVVYTETLIVPNDEVKNTVGDELEFEGERFVCVDYSSWGGYGLSLIPNFYECLFYRKDKL